MFIEGESRPPEQKLWRAILNQALEDCFGVSTLHLCKHEKDEAEHFFKVKSKDFLKICENAGVCPDRLWKRVQKLKGIRIGFLIPDKKDKKILDMFQAVADKRAKYVKSHWRNHAG